MVTTLKHIKFDEEDLKAVEIVQRLYGCENFSQAVRLATRIVANHRRTDLPLPPVSKHASERKRQSLLGIVRLPPEISAESMDKALTRAAQQGEKETIAEWLAGLDEPVIA